MVSSSPYSLNSTLMGVHWVKSREAELIELYVNTLATIPGTYYQSLSVQQSRQLAVSNLQMLIWRLEGNTFEADKLKSAFVAMLSAGVELQDLIAGTDQLIGAFTKKAQGELISQPTVCQALLTKVRHIMYLLKTMMAAAKIQYEMQKVLKPV